MPRVLSAGLTLAIALASATAHGGDGAEERAKAMQDARTAYAEYQQVRQVPFPREGTARAAWWRAVRAAASEFAEGCGRTDWDGWVLPADKELLDQGLTWYAVDAQRDHRWADARRAFDT